jgi:hypothetical protein
VKLSPRGEFCPLGVKFSVRLSLLLNCKLYVECLSLGVNEGVNIPPRGQISPRRPSSPLGVKLRMALRISVFDFDEQLPFPDFREKYRKALEDQVSIFINLHFG